MGTRGFRIYKFRGRYWIFYNHWDSYPDGLGQSLVRGIPVDPDEYQKWLQTQRDIFTKWDSMLQEFLTIQPEDMQKLHSDEAITPVFHAAFDERLYSDAPPCYEPGLNDLFIEWTYTIDLDREVFSVDNGAHFHLNHIPRNAEWIKALFCDNEGNRFLLPQLVPPESVASMSSAPPSFATSIEYTMLQTRLVKPKSLDHLSPSYLTGPDLRWMLFRSIMTSQQERLSVTLLDWQADELPFRELAFFIFCLATGGEHLALVDLRRTKEPYSGALYLGIPTSKGSGCDTELATSLGVGYHMDGLPMGCAPGETKYWFEGALICLTPRLDYPGILEKAVADAIEYGRASCTRKSFNAVLISIEHLVLIKSFPDGTCNHTELLPLTSIPTHLSQDPQARYGAEVLDAFYEANFTEAKRAHEETSDEEAEGIEDDPRMDDEERLKLVPSTRKAPVSEASIKNSFMALVQFFDATTRETLRPTQPNETRLPEEICEMVLRNVSDTKTYNACLKVSRRFRLICQKRPLVMDNVVFYEPFPKDPASLITKAKEEGTRKLTAPAFLAVELSSNRQMEVWLGSGGRRGNDVVTCLAVAGYELNRKTYTAECCVHFQGLDISAPEAEGARRRKKDAAWRRDESFPSDGSQPSEWNRAIRRHQIDNESETQAIGQLWEGVMRKRQALQRTGQSDLNIPPNTLCYLGTEELDDNHFHYLYLRIKRASNYWGNQWDHITREATENLNHTDNDYESKDEVIGADNPYVILVVGLEVRLFRWEQVSDDALDEGASRKKSPSSSLKETHPAKTLNIYDKNDTDVIDDFLQQVQRHKEMLGAQKWGKIGEADRVCDWWIRFS